MQKSAFFFCCLKIGWKQVVILRTEFENFGVTKHTSVSVNSWRKVSIECFSKKT